jgi:hypothetical protein
MGENLRPYVYLGDPNNPWLKPGRCPIRKMGSKNGFGGPMAQCKDSCSWFKECEGL